MSGELASGLGILIGVMALTAACGGSTQLRGASRGMEPEGRHAPQPVVAELESEPASLVLRDATVTCGEAALTVGADGAVSRDGVRLGTIHSDGRVHGLDGAELARMDARGEVTAGEGLVDRFQIVADGSLTHEEERFSINPEGALVGLAGAPVLFAGSVEGRQAAMLALMVWPFPLSVAAAEALARDFYARNEAIHETFDEPDLPSTPLIEELEPCEVAPLRRLSHPHFARFFGSRTFFAADTCPDWEPEEQDPQDDVIVSINRARQVRLVALRNGVRTMSPIWDLIGQVRITGAVDFRAFASTYLYVTTLEVFAPEQIQIIGRAGTGRYATFHYLEVYAGHHQLVFSSTDRLDYRLASTGRRDEPYSE
ncbi:MAG: hypothetical protein OEY14_09180 [Myxococcales bacterium]|nr:hypothetical protein [Myxococcales bacterium]